MHAWFSHGLLVSRQLVLKSLWSTVQQWLDVWEPHAQYVISFRYREKQWLRLHHHRVARHPRGSGDNAVLSTSNIFFHPGTFRPRPSVPPHRISGLDTLCMARLGQGQYQTPDPCIMIIQILLLMGVKKIPLLSQDPLRCEEKPSLSIRRDRMPFLCALHINLTIVQS